jgi:hypothetical protein
MPEIKTINPDNVFIGGGDLITGQLAYGPLGTSLPDYPSEEVDDAFVNPGDVGEDGVSLSPDYSTSMIHNWSGAAIRTVLENFEGTIQVPLLETNAESMKMMVGEEYYSTIVADATHGIVHKMKFGAHLAPAGVFLLRMKDGDKRMMIEVPNGQVAGIDEVGFTSSDAVIWPVTINCNDDGQGSSIYVITDDGQKVSA